MKVSQIFITILSFVLCCHLASGQKALIKQADQLMEYEKYFDALEIYNEVEGIDSDKETLLKRGICNYHTHHVNEAISDLGKAFRAGNDNKTIYLYMGKSYHAFGDYVEAAKFYKTYLSKLDATSEKNEIIDAIKQCGYGNNKRYDNQLAFIENLGDAVNSRYDEMYPTYSPNDQNKFYFSSNRSGSTGGLRNKDGLKDELIGTYSCDMYAVELQGGNWTSVIAFDPLLNSPKHDLIMGFNESGSVMYFIKSSDMESGIIYTDTFYENRKLDIFPDPLISPIVGELGDRDIQVFNDSTFLFSSNRQGGFGGYDIYLIVRGKDGWHEPLNLGPSINSKYDEQSPFLTKGGNRIYFSSNRLTSMGGFDIFTCLYGAETQVWSQVENVGIPINSPNDDRGWRMSNDGTIGIFSSNRIQSIGGYDLFMAYMKEPVVEQLFSASTLPFGQIKSAHLTENENGSDSIPFIKNIPPKAETSPKREYVNSPIYYDLDENILDPKNTKILNELVDLMKIYPDLKITFTSNSIKDGLPSFELYFSIKRAEKLSNYMINKGVDPKRITLRGIGSNFPLVLSQPSNMNSRLADRTNKRIDVSFYYNKTTPLTIVGDEPVVSESLRDDRGYAFKAITSGLVYRIKFGQVKQMLKSDVITQYNDSIIEKRSDANDYIYTSGVFKSYNLARQRKNELVNMNIVEAQVIPYLNNHALSQAEAELLTDTYPDLNSYLKFE